VPRVLIVDDSASVRSLLTSRLREWGYEVDEARDGESGADMAVSVAPDLVVTDLHMKGISGVQLCRVLRSDAATAHIPVVLLTASGDKRSRFWARTAGAAAYLSKDRLDDLAGLLPGLIAAAVAPSSAASDRGLPGRRTLQERMSAILDAALFESVVAGEVRALANAGEPGLLFDGLTTLMADVLTYRWMGLLPVRPQEPLFVHCHTSEGTGIEAVARSALGVAPGRAVQVVSDERAVASDGGPVVEMAIQFAGIKVGRLVVAPTARGFSRDDHRTIALVANELGGPLQMSALYQDAQRLATTDALTNLLNRRALLDVIERERARADRHSFPLSLLLLDVDHFKVVNDTRGHAAGDAVLQGVAGVLMSVARRSDCVARWGGEEFVVALLQTGEVGARIAGERIRRAIAESTHTVPVGPPIRVTASVGVASSAAPWKVEALVAAADSAMYAAKARGRNRVEMVSAAEMPEAGRRPRASIVASSK
jgi:two-component system, cell cycle response regulator